MSHHSEVVPCETNGNGNHLGGEKSADGLRATFPLCELSVFLARQGDPGGGKPASVSFVGGRPPQDRPSTCHSPPADVTGAPVKGEFQGTVSVPGPYHMC